MSRSTNSKTNASSSDRVMEAEDFFPVFDLLYKQIELMKDANSPLTSQEINLLSKKLKTMDKNGSDMIYILIRLYSLRYSDSRLLEVPYKGEHCETKINGTDIYSNVKFDLNNFPPLLCRMLDRFSTLHIAKMSEEVFHQIKNIK